jgi:hypothetical protein
MLGEPPARRALAPSAALGILAAARTFASAGLALEAARPAGPTPAAPALRPLAKAIEATLLHLAARLRPESRLPRLPSLRAVHARTADRVGEGGSPLEQLVLSEAEFMVDSLEPSPRSWARREIPTPGR